jgi:hypothetical protein
MLTMASRGLEEGPLSSGRVLNKVEGITRWLEVSLVNGRYYRTHAVGSSFTLSIGWAGGTDE